jgi:hypothetical protein
MRTTVSIRCSRRLRVFSGNSDSAYAGIDVGDFESIGEKSPFHSLTPLQGEQMTACSQQSPCTTLATGSGHIRRVVSLGGSDFIVRRIHAAHPPRRGPTLAADRRVGIRIFSRNRAWRNCRLEGVRFSLAQRGWYAPLVGDKSPHCLWNHYAQCMVRRRTARGLKLAKK